MANVTQGFNYLNDHFIGGTITETMDAGTVVVASAERTYAKPTAAWQQPAGVVECAIQTANLESRDIATALTARCLAASAITANEKVGAANTSGQVGPCPHGFPMVGIARQAQSTATQYCEVFLTIGEMCDRSNETTTLDAATYDVLITDHTILVDHTATAAVTITLPSAIIPYIRDLRIVDTGDNALTNNITIATEGSETIDGAASASIAADSGSIVLTSDGTNLFSL